MLLVLAEEVVDVVQPAVGDEQHMTTVRATLLEQDALCLRVIHGDIGHHDERLPA